MLAVDFRAFAVQGLDSLIRLRRRLPYLADTFAVKQQIVWIDVARLNKAAGLLSTTAWVCLVNQAALVVHEIAQVTARARESLSKILSGDFQHFGRDCVADTEDSSENVGHPLFAIETEQHPRGAGEHNFGHEQIRIRGSTFRIREVEVRRPVELLAVHVEIDGGVFDSRPLHIKQVVDDDPIEPCSEGTPALERRKPGQYFD